MRSPHAIPWRAQSNTAFPGAPASLPAYAPRPKRRRDVGTPSSTGVPRVSRTLLGWFTWYSRHYLRRHFHAVRVSVNSRRPPSTTDLPLVIYANHAAWWDPLVCLVLKQEFFPNHTAFAPMEAAMLERYRFFRRLGFFGVEQHTTRGAVQFLRMGEAILQSPQSLLALTPQGGFADVRQRPVRFAAGLGHLAARAPNARFVPVALEYVFWEERLPEVLVRFGESVAGRGAAPGASEPADWTRLFEQKLTETQEALAQEAQRRSPKDFVSVLRGDAGQGGVYDLWRWARARWRGEAFRKEHGQR